MSDEPMKLSELLDILQKVKKEHGDLPLHYDLGAYDLGITVHEPADVVVNVPGEDDGEADAVVITVFPRGTWELL